MFCGTPPYRGCAANRFTYNLVVTLPEQQSCRIKTGDGAEVFFATYGSCHAPSPTILILDGIGCSGWAFHRIVPELARDHQVVTMHYRGHGESPDPPRPWSLGIEVLADDAAAVCRHLQLSRVLLVGFSMGFQVALEVFRRHRPLVAGLMSLAGPSGRVLINFQGTDMFRYALPLVAGSAKLAASFVGKTWRTVLSSAWLRDLAMQFQLNADHIQPEDFDFYTKQLAAIHPELFLTMLEQADRHCADDVLPTIDVPTRIIAAARDTFVPLETMRTMAFAIPHGQWTVIPEASHALPAEFPERITDEIREFWSEVAQSLADT